jgi:hypothetical protein
MKIVIRIVTILILLPTAYFLFANSLIQGPGFFGVQPSETEEMYSKLSILGALACIGAIYLVFRKTKHLK